MINSIIEIFQHGGPFIVVNLLVLVISLAVIAERFFVVFFSLRISDRDFLESVEKQLRADNLEKAIKLCQLKPNAPLARVTKAALNEARRGPKAVAAAIDEALLEALPATKKRIEMLWSLANIATLFGLIGTILGLIGAFKALGPLPPELKTQKLTEGISEAMSNTAFGLTIAVICIVAHMLLSSATKRVSEGTEHGAVRVENMLARRRADMKSQMRDSSVG